MDDAAWEVWNQGWAEPHRDQTDVRYRDLLGDACGGNDADELPARGFCRGDDSNPVAAVPGNAQQQPFSAAADDAGELSLTPAQFTVQQQRDKEIADQREAALKQRTDLLEAHTQQQHQDALQQQKEVRQQQEAQQAELARRATVARAEASTAADGRKAVNAQLQVQATAADATA